MILVNVIIHLYLRLRIIRNYNVLCILVRCLSYTKAKSVSLFSCVSSNFL